MKNIKRLVIVAALAVWVICGSVNMATAGAIYDLEAGGTVDASGASLFVITAIDGRYNLGAAVNDTVIPDLNTVEGYHTIQITDIEYNGTGDDETGVSLWYRQSNINSAAAWAGARKIYIGKNITLGGNSTYILPYYPNDGAIFLQSGIEASGATPIHKVQARQTIK
ncbi:MAG: hypothetical protein SV375_00095 [Thermodesulfobacteriota bacterium]|nr:hypothetical protein [Thermodesulfobacteriota bacterium]